MGGSTRQMWLKTGESNHWNVRLACWCHRSSSTKWPLQPAKTQISLGICPVASVVALRMKKPYILGYQPRLYREDWSDWADAQVDLILGCVQKSFCWFVELRLKWLLRDGFSDQIRILYAVADFSIKAVIIGLNSIKPSWPISNWSLAIINFVRI